MNKIIEKLSSTDEIIGQRSQIFAGIGTAEGSIMIVFNSRRVIRKSIISRDRNTQIQTPAAHIQALDRGPTGVHNIYVGDDNTPTNNNTDAEVYLSYCHQSVCTLPASTCATLLGRTYIVNDDIDNDHESGDDETLEYELRAGQHVRILSGKVRIRISATGHRIYIDCKDKDNTDTTVTPTVRYEIV